MYCSVVSEIMNLLLHFRLAQLSLKSIIVQYRTSIVNPIHTTECLVHTMLCTWFKRVYTLLEEKVEKCPWSGQGFWELFEALKPGAIPWNLPSERRSHDRRREQVSLSCSLPPLSSPCHNFHNGSVLFHNFLISLRDFRLQLEELGCDCKQVVG